MRRYLLMAVMVVAATSCFAGVSISAPSYGSTVGSPVHFVASASGSAQIASMIIYVDGNQDYLIYSDNVDTYISLAIGSHYAVIKAWDTYGNVYSSSENFTVGSTSSSSTSSSGVWVNLSSPGNGVTVGSPVTVTANAGSANGISGWVVYVDDQNAFQAYNNSSSLSASVNVGAGTHTLYVRAWDKSNGQYGTSSRVSISVGSSGSGDRTWVNLSSPLNGSSGGSPVTVTANGGSPNGISGWVVYVDDQNAYQTDNGSNSLSASVNIGGGSHTLYVRAWDKSNGQYGTSSKISFSVSGSTSSSGSAGGSTVTAGKTIYDIQSLGGWDSCTVCAGANGNGPSASYDLWQWQSDPSMDGKSSRFVIWGGAPFSDVLWWKSVSNAIGNTTVPHHFIYDTYFMVDNSSAVQSMEFDINQFVNGHSLIFGTQCNVLDGNNWDIWDNQNNRWVHTGVWCGAPSARTWHHLTVEVERASDGGDWLHYVAITLDGNKHYIDAWYPPSSTGWSGITLNFQMDSDYAGHGYSTWLDKLTFSYW
jgi:Bacterial Ig domain